MPYTVPSVLMRQVAGVYRSWSNTLNSLVADSASYTLNNQPANLLRHRRLISNSNSFNINGQPAGLYIDGSIPNWQLPSTNTIGSIAIPLSLVNCHNTSNSNAWAGHRKSYPGLEWDWPIGIHGGRYPYYVEILSGPSGLTVGNQLSRVNGQLVYSNDTYRLSWENPIAGVYEISIRVTDQAGATLTRTFTHDCSTLNHVFVDPINGSDTTGNGTINNRYASLNPINTAGTFGQSICHVFSGTTRMLSSTGNFVLDGNRPSIRGVLGETPIFEQLDGWFTLNTGGDDKFIKGVEIAHATAGWNSSIIDRKCIAQLGDSSRNQLIDLKFSHYTTGPTAAGNPAVFSDLGGINNDQFCSDWEVTGLTGTIIQTFKHRNSLIQNIRVYDATLANTDSSSNGGVIKLKDGWSNLTIRNCEIWQNLTWSGNQGCIDIAGQDQSSLGINATDICYNKLFRTGSTTSAQSALRLFTHNQSPSSTNTHVYRNTLKVDTGDQALYNIFNPVSVRVESNVIENGSEVVATGWTNENNLAGTAAFTDSSLNLVGSYRNDYLGRRGSEVNSGWRLETSHYVPTQRTAELIFPRPDSETPVWAKHRRHYPGIRYEIPIGISFGSWPFYFEPIVMPSGATIGSFLKPEGDKLVVTEDYGVVRWDNPTLGSHSWHIRIHFQDGTPSLDVQWTTEVTTSGTIFVDQNHPSASDSNPGTEELPLLTLDGWFKSSVNDRTFTQYQVCYKTGSYDVATSDPETTGNMRLNYLNKPLVHYAYNDDIVEFDFLNTFTAAQGASVTSGGEYNFHDWFMGGIICKGGTQAATNGRRWNINSPARGPVEYTGVGGGLRCTWFKSPQIDWTYTGDPTNNTGLVYAPDTTVTTQCRQYWYVTQCPIRNILNGGLNFNGWFVGNVRKFLAEHIEVENTTFGRGPFSGKSSESLSCYRNIDMSKAPAQAFNYDNAGSYGPELGGGTEVSYCKVNRITTGAAATAVISGHHGDTYNSSYPNHQPNVHFRNSVSKAPSTTGEAFYAFANWPVEVIKDIWCTSGDGIYLNGPTNTQVDGDWKLYSIANNPFDDDMNLTGAARATYLGLYGAEVS